MYQAGDIKVFRNIIPGWTVKVRLIRNNTDFNILRAINLLVQIPKVYVVILELPPIHQLDKTLPALNV